MNVNETSVVDHHDLGKSAEPLKTAREIGLLVLHGNGYDDGEWREMRRGHIMGEPTIFERLRYRAFATVFTRSEARRSSGGRLLRNRNHGFGECRNAAYTVETDILEASVLQKRRQRGHRPELDVAVVPERREMLIHLPGDGESEVLEISVIRR